MCWLQLKFLILIFSNFLNNSQGLKFTYNFKDLQEFQENVKNKKIIALKNKKI